MKAPKRKHGWLWAGGLLFAAGYATVAILRGLDHTAKAPVIGSVVAVVLTIVIAARARRVLAGAGWGRWLVLAASLGIAAAMVEPETPTLPRIFELDLATATVAMAQCGGAVGPAWGAGLAVPVTIAFCAAPVRPAATISPELFQLDVVITAMTVTIPAIVAGAVFALLAERRRRRLEGDADDP